MNRYQKIALVVLRVEAYYTLLIGLRLFFAVTLYVSATYLSLFPHFYVNVGADVYWGFLYFASGLLMLAVSRPLALIIGKRIEDQY